MRKNTIRSRIIENWDSDILLFGTAQGAFPTRDFVIVIRDFVIVCGSRYSSLVIRSGTCSSCTKERHLFEPTEIRQSRRMFTRVKLSSNLEAGLPSRSGVSSGPLRSWDLVPL
jgi:hypothetical protein